MPGPFDFAEPQPDEADDYAPARSSWGGPSRSRMVYILLALFLGYLGVHNFYAGRFAPGIMQLIGVPLVGAGLAILSFLTGGLGLVALVPFVCFALAWPILEIILVRKDGTGRWMA